MTSPFNYAFNPEEKSRQDRGESSTGEYTETSRSLYSSAYPGAPGTVSGAGLQRLPGRPGEEGRGDQQGNGRGEEGRGDRQGQGVRGEEGPGDRQGHGVRGEEGRGDQQGSGRGEEGRGDQQGSGRGEEGRGDRQGQGVRGEEGRGDRQGQGVRGEEGRGDQQGNWHGNTNYAPRHYGVYASGASLGSSPLDQTQNNQYGSQSTYQNWNSLQSSNPPANYFALNGSGAAIGAQGFDPVLGQVMTDAQSQVQTGALSQQGFSSFQGLLQQVMNANPNMGDDILLSQVLSREQQVGMQANDLSALSSVIQTDLQPQASQSAVPSFAQGFAPAKVSSVSGSNEAAEGEKGPNAQADDGPNGQG